MCDTSKKQEKVGCDSSVLSTSIRKVKIKQSFLMKFDFMQSGQRWLGPKQGMFLLLNRNSAFLLTIKKSI